MSVGLITGSGTHALPGFADAEVVLRETPHGTVEVSRGRFAGVDVLHVSRHGAGHVRLSNHVTHRADVWALRDLGASAVIGCTACGAVDPALPLGSLVVFDDLHFPSNRLPDGSLCTFFTEPGDPARGHWVLHGGPFTAGIRAALLEAAGAAGHPVRDGGAYGHVDGPRFNTPAEIAQLAACGVVAVSQTGGPETVLCGELELPFALIGFVTDYANEVRPGEPTPVTTLVELMGRSTAMFADVLAGAVNRLAADGTASALRPAGTMLGFEQG
jgi:purine nucleoside phosphorylase